MNRERVDRGALGFAEFLRREGLELALGSMYYAARWITPPGLPRRYDTRFFVARLPAGQTPMHDDREAVHSEWMRPAQAIEGVAAGALSMLPPTLGMLRILAGFADSASALAAARQQQDGPDREARIVRCGDSWRVLLPGEAADGDDVFEGLDAWIRRGAG